MRAEMSTGFHTGEYGCALSAAAIVRRGGAGVNGNPAAV